MKKIIKFCSVAALICFAQFGQAQDNPVSYFQLTPLEVNPALVGNFYGTARIGAYQRLQWLDQAGGVKVSNIFIDAPLPLKFLGKKNWIGMGFNILSDKQGALSYGSTGGSVGLSFNRLLGKKGNSSFSVGLQYGSHSYGFNARNIEGLKTGRILSGTPGTDTDLQEFTNPAGGGSSQDGASSSISNFKFGIVYKSKLDKTSNISFGVALDNILAPDKSLVDTSAQNIQDGLGRNINGFFEYSRQINKKMKFSPAIYFEAQGKSFRTVLQGKGSYLLNAKKGIVLNAGIGYQHNSNVHLLIGADIKDLNVGLSYGSPISNVSGLDGLQNTIELGVSYIIKYYKKPKVKPVIFCPRL